ncbi:uncharacterized protein LOC127158578 [Labeo rohita]|uniref:uncharacterized protein LOC127158578 n=1 Tax=Labeo rohita TaxID=84645 RepID=UPI0021E2C078|nr:uncharacterized protein LOC127158578 [Labeo rohita]
MVFTVRLRFVLGIILLSCIQSVVNENVDINTLSRIQKFFHYNFENGQYAVAINVPKVQCQSGFYPSGKESTFLLKDMSEKVKPYIKPDSKDVYQGTELIAAGHHTDAHSEYLLMNPSKSSPLTNLLNKKKDGCVVFYTLISPCIDRCLNNNDHDNILPGLDELNKYKGIKAFAYTHIYKKDQKNKNLHDKLKKIADLVPLYRCNEGGCILCGGPGSKELQKKCIENDV